MRRERMTMSLVRVTPIIFCSRAAPPDPGICPRREPPEDPTWSASRFDWPPDKGIRADLFVPSPPPARHLPEHAEWWARSRAVALFRNRKFADSPLEGTGFELPVRGCDESGFHPFCVRPI